MKHDLFGLLFAAVLICVVGAQAGGLTGSTPPLGLPTAPEPADNPTTPGKH